MEFYVAVIEGKFYKVPKDVMESHVVSKEDYEAAVTDAIAELVEKPDVEGQGMNFSPAVAGVRG